MKSLMIIALLGISAFNHNYDLVAIRSAYASAAVSKSGLSQLRLILSAAPDVPLMTCYRGAAEMMEAKYTINPINKLSAFGKGKQLIENGIAADTNNVESRFIRYSIQRNLPGVLNYRDKLWNDSLMMAQRLDTLKDQDLKKRIINFMKRG